ncbi:MAG TPA: CocE/NonD family hydrolase, partial [Acidimicrobiales bacterium]|nr:CocE/NonD family hydrolase [Acidimicrobiales bacterium]
ALSALALAGAAPAAADGFTATGGAEQVYVTGLAPGARMSLLKPNGRVLSTQSADSLGGLLFRSVPPAGGYHVRLLPHGPESDAITVHSDAAAPWDPQIYDQTINPSGYQYLTTRDGTKLAIYVHPPTDVTSVAPGGITLSQALDTGPRPTLIEYAGYGYARPPSEGGAESSIELLANIMGFTVVDVNMRGTGCSGGAFDFFEPNQNLDGYDVIETIAHQPWVLDHKVGMMGISYGGISQLFTSQLDPPDLEAIAPMSVIDATATTLYPGGILNTGFAVAWADGRIHDAKPAGPNTGQPWAYQQIQQGDQTCKDNQVLHGEAANLTAKIHQNNHYIPSVADPLDPVTFVNKIHVPVFMACQWEDEQTGGHCPDLVGHFTGTKLKWFTFTNGAHIDSLDPYTYDRWYDFLELFVAHQAPMMNPYYPAFRASAPEVYRAAMGLPQNDPVTLPPDPIQQQTDYQTALSMFEALPPVRVLFDSGAGTSPTGQQTPGDPYPGFEQSFSTLPVPGTTARWWYFGPHGALNDRPPARKTVNWYRANPRALPLNDYANPSSEGGGLWGNASQWQWTWKPNPAGTAVSYVSAPLASDTTVVGAGAVHVWVRASRPIVDLQATISEVRPDGNETFVQNGYLHSSWRKLASGSANFLKEPSTLLNPIPSARAKDLEPLPRKRFVEVVIPLYYEGHVYRAGSRIRVTIAAPNGAQPVWAFSQTRPPLGKTAKVWVAFSKRMPSSLILPVVPGVSVPTGLPPCPGLRNEPCRPYQAFTNQVAPH